MYKQSSKKFEKTAAFTEEDVIFESENKLLKLREAQETRIKQLEDEAR
jgi:hypothetical protein